MGKEEHGECDAMCAAGYRSVWRSKVVRIRLLGGFSVLVGSRTIAQNDWLLRKAATLVKLLALAPGHRMHREQAMDLSWPESGRRAASNSLRTALHAARKVVDPEAGCHYLASEVESLVLCSESSLWVYVDAFEEVANTARRSQDPVAYGAAIALYAGELLLDDRYQAWAQSCGGCSSRDGTNKEKSLKTNEPYSTPTYPSEGHRKRERLGKVCLLQR
jgi:two-component SAPR family response regulator